MADFKISAEQLQDLVDPKNKKALASLGGPLLLAKKLKSDPNNGLSKAQIQSHEMKLRLSAYGNNLLPEPPIKSLLSLIWEGLQDNTLIMLIISAVISFILGIHEDPSTGWIEGTAIMVAVVVVVLVASVNDYEKVPFITSMHLFSFLS
eukprot:Sdes_comp16293_c0_seq1m5645